MPQTPSRHVMHSRILACHFTHLPTDRILRQRLAKALGRPSSPAETRAPVVVVDTLKNALRVVAMEHDTRLAGIACGQSLSDARAIFPGLEVVARDRDADAALLRSVARWCERYTPLVALADDDTLFLDITGCAHLFGGEETMMEDMASRLRGQGFHVQVAIADTPGAAWALSHFDRRKISPQGGHRELIAPLPLSALRLSPDKVRELARLGFKTVGCLVGLPRAPIAARFGPDVLRRLDQALGHEDEAISPIQPVSELVSEKRFPDPVAREDDIKATIRILCADLAKRLEKRGLGMRRCELAMFRADGEVAALGVEASSPLRHPTRMASLFDERLASLHDEWEAGFGFDIIRLSVVCSDVLAEKQSDLAGARASGDATSNLVDRLAARLGNTRVQVCRMADTRIPERRVGFVAALHQAPDILPHEHLEVATRPLLMLERPEIAEVMAQVPDGPPIRFRWRKVRYEVTRSEGPERIACEWWKDGRAAHTRDYFRVETSDGHRLWLFRHGLYGRESDSPKWYVHGMFG